MRFKAVAGRVDRAGGIAVRLDRCRQLLRPAGQCAWRTTSTSITSCSGSRREIRGVGAKVASGSVAHAEPASRRRSVHHRLQRQDAVHCGRPDLRECRQGRAVDEGRQRHAVRCVGNPAIAMKRRVIAQCELGMAACPVRLTATGGGRPATPLWGWDPIPIRRQTHHRPYARAVGLLVRRSPIT